MWVRTQDGKLTIKVDRFEITPFKNGYEEKERTARLSGEEEYKHFLQSHNDCKIIRTNYFDADVFGAPTWGVIYSIPVYVYAIVCNDVVLGEYSTMAKAEYVRSKYIEALIKEGLRGVVYMPWDDEVILGVDTDGE